jgi:hypothetical protein
MTLPIQPSTPIAQEDSRPANTDLQTAIPLSKGSTESNVAAHSDAIKGPLTTQKRTGTGSTLEKLNRTRTQFAAISWDSFVKQNKPPLIQYGKAEKVVRLSDQEWGIPENWFILGDIHGDFYALSNALKYITKTCPDFRLIFLGDLIDRGPHPMECLWLLLAYATRFPERILWIAGNHDVAVHEKEDGSFWGSVQPSEFLDHLNAIDSWTPFRREFGREFIELVKDLPRAVLFPDGLLVTHGGFPLVDLHKDLQLIQDSAGTTGWLNSPQALQDFTWTRITRSPRKIPNRQSTGCSYGFNDFAAFCDVTKDFFPTSRLVTGHDHPAGGIDLHPEWKTHAALTLKGYGFADDYERPDAFHSKYQKNLAIARCRRGDIPEPILIPVEYGDLTDYFENEISGIFKAKNVEATQPADPGSA